MSENTQKRTFGIQRYFVSSHRTAFLRVITSDRCIRQEQMVRIVDVSVNGVGIESQEIIEPGLVCFKEPLSGHKFGIVAWRRQQDGLCRAGIGFLTLPYEQEQYILDQVRQTHARQPLQDPEKLIASLLEPLKTGHRTSQ